MPILLTDRPAFTGNATQPRWTRGDKDAVGTGADRGGNLWYTISEGVVTEVYFPTVDTPQIRDLQFLVTDGTFFHDGRRDLEFEYESLGQGIPGFRVTSRPKTPPEYTLVQEILSTAHQPCLLISVNITSPDPALLKRLKVYALLAPHLDGAGAGNDGYVAQTPKGNLLVAHRNETWLALGASVPFLRCSCGYVGVNDGWTDVSAHKQMTWEFTNALNGNIALTGELDLSAGPHFVLGLGFGTGAFGSEAAAARVALANGLLEPFRATGRSCQLRDFVDGWAQKSANLWRPAGGVTGDKDHLYDLSRHILLCHEDKVYEGAFVASLSIPWGEIQGDKDSGYHLVWPRDMCQSATALLAAGHVKAALRALIFLSCSQEAGGRFNQNFFLDGQPYWTGTQLDEIAAPIMLAYRLQAHNGLEDFDPIPTILAAAGSLILLGPQTQEERWEEAGGYSPSTLAAQISGIICAAALLRKLRNTPQAASIAAFLEQYADFLETSLDGWTVTRQGQLVPGVSEYYVRISNRESPDASATDPNWAWIHIANRGDLWLQSRNVVDAGFLELVRYGVRDALNPIIVQSLKVIDAVSWMQDGVQTTLKVDFGDAPCWKRYNEDGYGQHANGQPFDGQGRGGPWPLLTGERGHRELAAGQDSRLYIRAMEKFAIGTGLLPEQLWDLPDLPAAHMIRGQPTGCAVPLAWAHAEYIKLVRSTSDGVVFDRIPEVYDRYTNSRTRRPPTPPEFWNFQRQIGRVSRGRGILRFALEAEFRLHWSGDNWRTVQDTPSTEIAPLGVHYVDVALAGLAGPLRFTFFWPGTNRWEGRDYMVDLT